MLDLSQILKAKFDRKQCREQKMFGSRNEEIKRNLISVKLVTVRGLPKFFDMIFFVTFQTLRALELLQKFQNIGGVQLDLHDKYQRILMQYGR